MRRLPLKGIGGLAFMAAVVTLAVVYVPVFRWFLAIAIPLGVVVALVLHCWHKHAPVREPENKKKVLHLDDR